MVVGRRKLLYNLGKISVVYGLSMASVGMETSAVMPTVRNLLEVNVRPPLDLKEAEREEKREIVANQNIEMPRRLNGRSRQSVDTRHLESRTHRLARRGYQRDTVLKAMVAITGIPQFATSGRKTCA